MQVTFLGTSSGAPTLKRNMAGIALRLPQSSTVWLFDCGEGTQHQAMRAGVRLSRLERIFITHLHGDHVFGLPGLLASRSLQASSSAPLTIYGPAGVEELVTTCLRLTETALGYPIQFVPVSEGVVYSGGGFTVACAPARHRIDAYMYAIREGDRPGAFDARQAESLGIPAGPLYGQLKAGQSVTLPDGKIVHGTDLAGPARPGRLVVYTGDTGFGSGVVGMAQGADLLIHEATYLSSEEDLAERAGHSTVSGAAAAARDAGVKRLVLTHFSARYETGRMAELLEEARGIFPNTELAEDLAVFEVEPSRQAAG